MTSRPNTRASWSIAFLCEWSHHTPTPMSASKIITTTRPSPLDRHLPLEIFISVTEPDSFNDLSVANQGSVFLKTGVGAEAIAGIDLEVHQPGVIMLAVLAGIGADGLAFPLDLRRVCIDQILLHPIPNNFLVDFRI